MNLKEIAAELALLTVLKDLVKEATEELRELAKNELLNVGADMTKAVVDNQEVAKITLISRDCDFVINDDRAFLTWVRLNAPTEIEERVRDSYRKVFLQSLIMNENNGIFSTINGALIDFAQLIIKEPYVSTRFAPEGRAAVTESLHDRMGAMNQLASFMQTAIQKEIE